MSPFSCGSLVPGGFQLLTSVGNQFSPVGSVTAAVNVGHHIGVGTTLVLASSHLRLTTLASLPTSVLSHMTLSVALGVTGTLSIVHGHHVTSMPAYPFLTFDYATVLCLFTHHMWIGSFLTVGSVAHAGIHLVRSLCQSSGCFSTLVFLVLSHRDLLIGHLSWVCILLGTHSFGAYLHNDTLASLGRLSDLFSDSCIRLSPVFAGCLWYYVSSCGSPLSAVSLAGKLGYSIPILGTSDFLVHHIHAFTVHVTVLVSFKAILFSRSSRLVGDKLTLGFRYPCDGPGRGGTCQISPYDHMFLTLFWSYNTVSVVIFHASWYMQSSVWGTMSSGSVTHVVSDFNSSGLLINGYLSSYLWSQASQVIQSYGTSSCGYSLLFLVGHFTWALSLMFLYSGRGYWQELVESILWAHSKIRLAISLQPRALSITQGRFVGLTHYLLGGILTTWSFFHARLTTL